MIKLKIAIMKMKSEIKNTRHSYGRYLCYIENANQAQENLTTKSNGNKLEVLRFSYISWTLLWLANGQNTRDQPELNQSRGLVEKTSYNTTSKWPPR